MRRRTILIPCVGAMLLALRPPAVGWSASSDTNRVGPGVPQAARFKPHWYYRVGSWPQSVGIGDFNGDGRNDVALSTGLYFDPSNDYKLFVFLQQADGSLAPPIKYRTDAISNSDRMGLSDGDLNGDGKTDLALATWNGVGIYLQGSGGLRPPVLLPTASPAFEVKASDMNLDGRLDLVVSGLEGVSVMLNTRTGFTTGSSVTSNEQWDIEVGDLSNDGRPDVVGCDGANLCALQVSDSLNVFVQGQRGKFIPTGYQGTNPFNPSGSGVGIGDVNGDGLPDVVMSGPYNRPLANINVFLQVPGTGRLSTAVALPSYDIPEPVETADVDLDGRKDVVTLHSGWGSAGIYYQGSDGTLGTEYLYPITNSDHYSVSGLAIGDVSGDGLPDIVLSIPGGGGLDVLYQIPG